MLKIHHAGLAAMIIVLALGAAACRTTDPPDVQIADARITTEVKASFADRLNAETLVNVSVNTHNAVVTLSGVVENEQQRQQAEQIARNVDGVKDVNNNLQVRTANTTPPGGAPY